MAAVWRASCNRASRTPGFLQKRLPVVLIATRVDRLAVGLGEHPIALVPFTSRVFLFTVLDLAVLRDEREQFVRQGDLTASGSRFEIRLDQAAVASLWAPSGMTCAVGRARGWACALVLFAIRLARFCLVITGTACMRVVAPMLPRPPLQRLADSQCLGLSIETRPFEAERFALPDAERQSNDEPDTISLRQSQTQQRSISSASNGSISSSSTRGGLARSAGFRVMRRRLNASPNAVRAVRCT